MSKLAQDKVRVMDKYLVIGLAKAGKSTLINRLVGKRVIYTHDLKSSSTSILKIDFHLDRKYLLAVDSV